MRSAVFIFSLKIGVENEGKREERLKLQDSGGAL